MGWHLKGFRFFVPPPPGIFVKMNNMVITSYRWVPEQEKSLFISCTYVGGSFGTVIVFPLSGLILHKLDWEVIERLT